MMAAMTPDRTGPSQSPNAVEVRTPARLHLGMLSFGNARSRSFGGVGVMVDRPGVLRHHSGLEPDTCLGFVPDVDDELPGPAGVGQNATAHRHRRPGGRRLEPTDHHPRQQQHVVGDVKHALRVPGQMLRRLAAGKGPQHQPLDAGRRALVVVDPRPHGGDVHAAGGIHAGDESFEDHGRTGDGNGRTTVAMINFGIPAPIGTPS